MRSRGKNKTHNRLWLARKRKGLGQKQVAVLLNHRTVDQVSRFEKGLRLPNLETALRLEIIYNTPLSSLYKDTYERLREEIKQKIQDSPSLRASFDKSAQDAGDYCAYAESLRVPSRAPNA